MQRTIFLLFQLIIIFALKGADLPDNQNTLIEPIDTTITPAAAISISHEIMQSAELTAHVLFNPVMPQTTTPQANPYALESINSVAIDALYGAQGLNIKTEYIQYLKNFYFYLEYLVRIEYAAKLATVAEMQNIDFFDTIETADWPGLILELEKSVGSWAEIKKLLSTIHNPSWDAVPGTIIATSWQNLVSSSFWKSFQGRITHLDIQNSLVWQNYVKYVIANTFFQTGGLLTSIFQTEATLFKYIPNLEVAYYNSDFTILRNGSEIFRLNLLLVDALRNRFLPQSEEWHALDGTMTYSAAQTYQTTAFYKIVSFAEQDPTRMINEIAQGILPIDAAEFKKIPLIKEQLNCFGMIKNIQALLNFLYDKDHLATTMRILHNEAIAQPQPSILFYTPNEYVYLNALAELTGNFVSDAATRTPPQAEEMTQIALLMHTQKNEPVAVAGFWGDLWNDLKETGSEIAEYATKGSEYLEDAGGHIASALKNQAEALGLGAYGSFLQLTGIDPEKAKTLLAQYDDLRQKAYADLRAVDPLLHEFVDNIAIVAKLSTGHIIGKTVGALFSVLDPKLGESVEGLLISVFDIAIQSSVEAAAHLLVPVTLGIARIGTEIVNIMADSIINTVLGDFSALGSDLLQGMKTLGLEIAVTLLDAITVAGNTAIENFTNLIKASGYLISYITRQWITVARSVTFMATVGASIFNDDIDAYNISEKVKNTLYEHERTMNAIITTGILLASVPMTGGTSLAIAGMAAMTIGPEVFTIMSGAQQDAIKIEEKAEQKEFLDHYQAYVANNKIINTLQQKEWARELDLKYEAQINNQERALGFYENFLNSSVNNLKKQLSETLGQRWAYLFTPDPTYGVIAGDVGSLCGMHTDVYELNPSQGFALYNNARKSFSQEIAVAPSFAAQGSEQAIQHNWFNQKEMLFFNEPLSDIEIAFQGIYTLNNFYIGLYIGEQPISINQIKMTKKAPLDMESLAKMIVYKKSAQQNALLGVYEHEGIQWAPEPLYGPEFKLGTWFHIKAQLVPGSTQLKIKVWDESEEEPPLWQSFTVTADPGLAQTSFGIISSGAAIEYKIVTPRVEPKPIDTVRRPDAILTANGFQSIRLNVEKEREKRARARMYFALHPQQGPLEKFQLRAYDKIRIIRKQFIYITTATRLIAQDGSAIEDYVVPVSLNYVGPKPISVIEHTIGGSPIDNSSVMSLVTGKIFDFDIYQNTIRDTGLIKNDFLTSYLQTQSGLPDRLTTRLLTLQSERAADAEAFTFGDFTFNAVSNEALKNNIFIYTIPLKDSEGNIIPDAQDYVMITDFTTFGFNQQQMSEFTDSVIISFVTGSMYMKDESNPELSEYNIEDLWNAYHDNFYSASPATQAIITEIAEGIKDAIAAYNTPSTGTILFEAQSAVTDTHTDELAPVAPSSSDSVNEQAQPMPAEKSIEKRTEQAGNNTI